MAIKVGHRFTPYGTDAKGTVTDIIMVKGEKVAIYHYDHSPKTHFDMPVRELESKTWPIGNIKLLLNSLYGKMQTSYNAVKKHTATN